MGMLPQRACANSGCYATRLQGSKYCLRHQNTTTERVRDPIHKLRKTARWAQCRRNVLSRDPMCQCNGECGAHTGLCLWLSTDVHHRIDAIEYTKQHDGDPASFFDEDNLQGLCRDCHSRITRGRQ